MATLMTIDRRIREQLRRGGIDPSRATIGWSAREDRDHSRSRRRYASVDVRSMDFAFARATADLDQQHLDAVVAHEVGHVLAYTYWGDLSEEGADRAAKKYLGASICYDHAWPGKGLQILCETTTMKRNTNAAAECRKNHDEAREFLAGLGNGDRVFVTTDAYGARALQVTSPAQQLASGTIVVYVTSGKSRGSRPIQGGSIELRPAAPGTVDLVYQPTIRQQAVPVRSMSTKPDGRVENPHPAIWIAIGVAAVFAVGSIISGAAADQSVEIVKFIAGTPKLREERDLIAKSLRREYRRDDFGGQYVKAAYKPLVDRAARQFADHYGTRIAPFARGRALHQLEIWWFEKHYTYGIEDEDDDRASSKKRTPNGVAYMRPDAVYVQHFSSRGPIYFLAKSQQKNGGWKGMTVSDEGGRRKKKAKHSSVPKLTTQLWSISTDTPADVLEAFGIQSNPAKKLIRKEGKLGGKGYATKTTAQRHQLLDRCVKRDGYRSCLGRVQVLLLPSELKPKTRRTLLADKSWLVKRYGGPGSFGPQRRKRKRNPEAFYFEAMEIHGFAVELDDSELGDLEALAISEQLGEIQENLEAGGHNPGTAALARRLAEGRTR